MPPFNAELACKALEQRVTGLERAIDALRKATQPDANAARANKTEDRLTKVENVVKTLAETRTASKVEAMEKTLKALDSAKLIDQDTLHKLNAANDDKRNAQQEAESKRLTEEARKNAQAIIDKERAAIDKQIAEVQRQNDAIKVEARLTVLEAQMKTALAKS